MAIIYSGFQDGSRKTPGQQEEARWRERNLYNVANQLSQAALQQNAIDNYLNKTKRAEELKEQFKDLPEKKGAMATILSMDLPQALKDVDTVRSLEESVSGAGLLGLERDTADGVLFPYPPSMAALEGSMGGLTGALEAGRFDEPGRALVNTTPDAMSRNVEALRGANQERINAESQAARQEALDWLSSGGRGPTPGHRRREAAIDAEAPDRSQVEFLNRLRGALGEDSLQLQGLPSAVPVEQLDSEDVPGAMRQTGQGYPSPAGGRAMEMQRLLDAITVQMDAAEQSGDFDEANRLGKEWDRIWKFMVPLTERLYRKDPAYRQWVDDRVRGGE
jgi:uncharacterized membrane protein